MSDVNQPGKSLFAGENAERESLIERFEEAWLSETPPALAEFAANLDKYTLVELVHVDLECRLKRGDAARVEMYMEAFPELAADPGVAMNLIANEYELRLRRESDLSIDEFRDRFPQFSEELAEKLMSVRNQSEFQTVSNVAATEATITYPDKSSAAPDSGELGESQDVEQLRDYRLLEKIGEGGMGTVYKAVHERLGKTVAIKVLSEHVLKDGQAAARFDREMLAVGALDHPNIVRATDAGEVDGRHFLVMEFVDGVDVATIAKQQTQLPIADACEIIRQAAVGLQHVHECGLVHRDVKPSNLMLCAPTATRDAACIKILDLGLARLNIPMDVAAVDKPASDIGMDTGSHHAQRDDVTVTGQLMGTFDYMAPEQTLGGDVDIRVDIYSMGSTLYRLIAGRAPFATEDPQTPARKIIALVQQEPTPLNELRIDVPDELRAIVDRMLAKDPAVRFQAPWEVADALVPFCESAALTTLLADDGRNPGTTATLPGRVPDRGRLPGRKVPRWNVRSIILAVIPLVTMGLLAGVIIRLNTPDGVLVVEADDPRDLIVEIDGRKALLTLSESGKSVELSVGAETHSLVVRTSDGVRLITDSNEITIAPGKRKAIRAWLEKPERDGTTEQQASAPAPWKPTPEQQGFFDAVGRLDAEQQVEAVLEKLRELNPEFDGKATPTISDGKVFRFSIITDDVTDVWPVRALADLKSLNVRGSDKGKGKLADLAPLEGMRLTYIDCKCNPIADLSPLKDMQLNYFYAAYSQFTDLAPLKGMPLTTVHCYGTEISDLSPLEGMPLTNLMCSDTAVQDLTPLTGAPLTELNCSGSKVQDLAPLTGAPLTFLNIASTFVADLAPLADMPLTELQCKLTPVSDLSPLRGKKLKTLNIHSTKVLDLSPLAGMPLTELECSYTPIADLTPIAGMKLTSLNCWGTQVTDLSPIEGMPLTNLRCGYGRIKDLSPLKGMPLVWLWVDFRSYYRPDEDLLKSLSLTTLNGGSYPYERQPVADFWKEVDAHRESARIFAAETAKLSAKEQVAAVVARLNELNSDGTQIGRLAEGVENGEVTFVSLELKEWTTDIAPLLAFKSLKRFVLVEGSPWFDISPISLLPLEELTCQEVYAARNAGMLREMKTLKKINGQPVDDYLKRLLSAHDVKTGD